MPRLRSAAVAAAVWMACLAASIATESARAARLPPDSTAAREVPAPPVVRAAEWETLVTGLPEEARFRRIVGLRYNRVDGPAPTLGAAFQTGKSPAPVLFAQATYAYSREKLLYEAGYSAPFGDRPLFSAGGSFFRRTATEDEWIVPEGGNTIFAPFARPDYPATYES